MIQHLLDSTMFLLVSSQCFSQANNNEDDNDTSLKKTRYLFEIIINSSPRGTPDRSLASSSFQIKISVQWIFVSWLYFLILSLKYLKTFSLSHNQFQSQDQVKLFPLIIKEVLVLVFEHQLEVIFTKMRKITISLNT